MPEHYGVRFSGVERRRSTTILGALTLAFLAAAVTFVVDSVRGTTDDLDRRVPLVFAAIAILVAGVIDFLARAVWPRRRTLRDEPRS